jgi:alanine dehydrogenase
MNIGIPREHRPFEYRVGMAPRGLQLLTQHGHTCYIEHNAGLGSGFSDEDYERAGAHIVFSPQEAFLRGDLVLKVQRPTDEEIEWLREGQILAGFLMLPSARHSKITMLMERGVTAISYELIEGPDGEPPVMKPLSQIGGRLCAQIAAHCLENSAGGKGILLGGVAGVPPADVVIIGAGTVGLEAARAFLSAGASVHVLDIDLRRLQQVEEKYDGRVVTMVAYPFNIARACSFADVLVSCVRVPARRAPIVVTREVVRQMRPRSLIMDLSIDEGGSVETSRPTHHDQPTYVEEQVIHYCVPNMPSAVARTATHAFLNAAWPFIQMLSERGVAASMIRSPALARGVTIHDGKILDHRLAEQYEMEAR